RLCAGGTPLRQVQWQVYHLCTEPVLTTPARADDRNYPMQLPFHVEAFLQAILGVAYVGGGEGVMLGFSLGAFLPGLKLPGSPLWDHGHAVGTSIFSIVQGEPVRRSYRMLHEAAFSGSSEAFGFAYRCDAPDVERHMFMSVSRIVEGTSAVAV